MTGVQTCALPIYGLQQPSRFGIHAMFQNPIVHYGSNPKRGATTFLPQLRVAVFVDSSASRLLRPYPQHSAGFSLPLVLSGWKRGIAGVQAQPPGLRPNPTFSLANSPVSPVDRSRLLTAAPAASLARIRHILHVLARRAFSPVGREASRGCKLNP